MTGDDRPLTAAEAAVARGVDGPAAAADETLAAALGADSVSWMWVPVSCRATWGLDRATLAPSVVVTFEVGDASGESTAVVYSLPVEVAEVFAESVRLAAGQARDRDVRG